MAAETVGDLVSIELVRLQVVGAGVQREDIGREKAQQEALAAAMRTVAADRRSGRLGVDGEAYGATMAATLERHDGLLVDEQTAATDIGMASSLQRDHARRDRKSTRLNSSHLS